MRSDRTGLSDFFDENGTLIGTDGVDDGYKYIGNRQVYDEARTAGTDWGLMAGQQGVYELPSEQAMNDIFASVIGPLRGKVNDDLRREYGGVVGNDGAYYEAPAGPIATGASQYPEIDLGPAAQKAASNSAGVAVYVHSHVNFELKTDGTTMQGTNVPSSADRSMLTPNKSQQYGMMLYPRLEWDEKIGPVVS